MTDPNGPARTATTGGGVDTATPEEPTARPARRGGLGQRRNVIIGIVLLAGFSLGVGLVLLGGDDGDPTTTTETTATMPAAQPLELEDLSVESIEALTGLVVPSAATGFQSAITETRTQLDVTFVIPESAEAEFVETSGLAEPVEGERTILHSSPMWKLNADDATTFRGVADETDQVRRAVELVPNGDGTTTVRVVITAA